jgi:hypothetical protein
VQEIAAEEFYFLRDSRTVFLLQFQFTQSFQVQVYDGVRFPASLCAFSTRLHLSDTEEAVGYSFHRRHNDGDGRMAEGFPHQLRSVKHALGSQKGIAAKLESDDFSLFRGSADIENFLRQAAATFMAC